MTGQKKNNDFNAIGGQEGLDTLRNFIDVSAACSSLETDITEETINHIPMVKVSVKASGAQPLFKKFEETVMGTVQNTIIHENPYDPDNHTLLIMAAGEDPFKKTTQAIMGFQRGLER